MIEIAGLVLSGVSFAKDLYKKYKDYISWPQSDLQVDNEWLQLAIKKGILKGAINDYVWARPEKIPTLELRGSHEVVVFFNNEKKRHFE